MTKDSLSNSNDTKNDIYEVSSPKFQWSFLRFKYWSTWLVIIGARLITLLPYCILIKLGNLIGRIFSYSNIEICQQRRHIARVNIDMAFANHSQEFRDKIYNDFCRNVGQGIIDVAIAWFYSDRKFLKLIKLPDLENNYIKEVHQKKPYLFLCPHFLNIESVGRTIGYVEPSYGSYLPNSNPVWDWFQYTKRAKNNKALVSIRNFRNMIQIIKRKEGFFYAPDQDLNRNSSVFVPFLDEPKTCTTKGTFMIYKIFKDLTLVPVIIVPSKDPKYRFEFKTLPPLIFEKDETPESVTTKTNAVISEMVLINPSMYMWFHRRFHNRPDQTEYIYEVSQKELHNR